MIKMESRTSKLTKLQSYSQSIRSLFTSGLRLGLNHHNNVGLTLLYELQSLNGNILKVSDITLINLILYGG